MVSATDAEAPDPAISRVVICGGGVIGTAVSYYLAKQGVQSTVVDRCGLAAAASGRAGAVILAPIPPVTIRIEHPYTP